METAQIQAFKNRSLIPKRNKAGRVVWVAFCAGPEFGVDAAARMIDLTSARADFSELLFTLLQEFQCDIYALADAVLEEQARCAKVTSERNQVSNALAATMRERDEMRTAGKAQETKLLSDLQDATHKALNYKSQRDQALRDNARLRGLLTLLADNIKASANTCAALEAMAHDLPANAPEKEGG